MSLAFIRTTVELSVYTHIISSIWDFHHDTMIDSNITSWQEFLRVITMAWEHHLICGPSVIGMFHQSTNNSKLPYQSKPCPYPSNSTRPPHHFSHHRQHNQYLPTEFGSRLESGFPEVVIKYSFTRATWAPPLSSCNFQGKILLVFLPQCILIVCLLLSPMECELFTDWKWLIHMDIKIKYALNTSWTNKCRALSPLRHHLSTSHKVQVTGKALIPSFSVLISY